MTSRKSSFENLSDTAMDRFLRRHHPSIKRSFLRIFLISGLIAGTLLSTMSFFWLKNVGIFDFNEKHLSAILNYKPYDNSIVFDRNGRKIGEFFSSYYIYRSYENIPQGMIDAITAIEDRNFFEHDGIDPKAIIRAALSYLDPSAIRQGASTITQQVVRNFLLTQERTIERKIREITLAMMLEEKTSKEKIMEIYLNALFLGNGAYGVAAAAQRYFGKPLEQLGLHQIALIAGLFQSPSGYNPHKYPKRAKRRQRMVLRAMYDAGKISLEQARQLVKQPLNYVPYNPTNFETAPYFVSYVRERTSEILGAGVKNRGLRIYTTLDKDIQKLAKEALADSNDLFVKAKLHLANLEAQQKDQVEAALVATEPETGHILAMFGGRSYQKSQYNRAAHAKRAPGSAFKPIVYSLALENGHKWSDAVYVSPVAVDDYRPRNHSNSYLTESTLLKAFYKSINTPVIELGQKLGLNRVLNHAKRLGVKTELRQEAGSLLGGSEVTMLDMATVYGTLANQGVKVNPIAILKITDRHGKILYDASPADVRGESVMSPQIAYLMTEGLRSVFHHGTGYRYKGMGEYAVGKTGTTNNARDNWFCGYTSDLTTVVWLGTDDPAGFTEEIAASTLALPLWADFMQKVATVKMPDPTEVPDGIVSEKVNPHFGNLDPNGIPMFFLEGQTPTQKQSSFKAISRSGSYRNLFDR
jgi:penicillin-binding protein 1A